ncbi:amino acid permease [Corynebacterium aquatimens]|uniref:Aromatic amino acid permease n=1 Tax=Corynebacterium aquatimens TaxID=1190508 RepID=A0A931DWA5_9CORY|nr:amino acid permease [Corynebacterium aquatimens]MBG6121280.1 aromatic amino acid permease [Corynebacterium aquatimens]WJY66170.1 GABA permease [Corynebacterium aquatimens]
MSTAQPAGSNANAAASPAATSATNSEGLNQGLKTRHLTMMGLGSTIGAGLFLGTGVGIQAAGPAVIIAYIIAGFVTVCVMQMLAEMVAARPSSGSFATYADQAFGPRGGFTLGWLYWFMQMMIVGAEITGASFIISGWFDVAPWIPAAIAVVLFTGINLMAVRGYGEFEFWFALIKVVVIIAFLIIGILLVFGLLPGSDAVGFSRLSEVGFAPNGIGGIATAMLAVVFAFGGIEVVTIAAAESENPKESVHAAIRSAIWRIGVFYIGSVFLIILLLPYSEIGKADDASESPFTTVLSQANIPGAVGIMEVVIVMALLSACNAQLYGSSRLLYSMSRGGDAPKFFNQTNASGVPTYAVLLSIFFAIVTVALNYWSPPGLLTFLLNAVGGCLLAVWIGVIASYLKLHPELVRTGEITEVRMWGYPWLAWVTLATIFGFVTLMLFNQGGRLELASTAVIVAIIVVASLIVHHNSGANAQTLADRERVRAESD